MPFKPLGWFETSNKTPRYEFVWVDGKLVKRMVGYEEELACADADDNIPDLSRIRAVMTLANEGKLDSDE